MCRYVYICCVGGEACVEYACTNLNMIVFCKNTNIIGLIISRRGLEKTAEGSISSASAAGSDVLDPELAGVDSESSFDEDQETTEERETTTSEASSIIAVYLMDRLRVPKKSELSRKCLSI